MLRILELVGDRKVVVDDEVHQRGTDEGDGAGGSTRGSTRAEVEAGDLLVGKVTPKGETQLTPEEKLLRAIFGEKAGDVRDASLKVPPGIEGTIVDVKIFSRKGIDKDLRALSIEQDQIAKIEKNSKDEIRIIREEANKKIRDLLVGKVSNEPMNDRDGEEVVKKGGKFTDEGVARLSPQQLKRLKLKDEEIAEARKGPMKVGVKELKELIQFLRKNDISTISTYLNGFWEDDEAKIRQRAKAVDEIDPDLTLKGLKIIYDRNRGTRIEMRYRIRGGGSTRPNSSGSGWS